MKLLVFTWFVLMVGVASNGFCNDKITKSDSPDFNVEEFVESSYHRLAIDTTGEEPIISAWILTDGDFTQLDSMGIKTGSEKGVRWGNNVHVFIQVGMIPEILSLESVLSIRYSWRVEFQKQAINHPPYDSTLGEISGRISGECFDSATRIEFLLRKYDMDIDFKSANSPVSNNIERANFSVIGEVLIPHLAPGLYQGTIRFIYENQQDEPDNKSSRRNKICGDFIIENMRVKPGYTSFFYFEGLSHDFIEKNSSCIWEGLFIPLK